MGQAKLTRALIRGGIAERRADGAYRIWRNRNRSRRALGTMDQRRGDELRSEGKITLLSGHASLYVWAAESVPPEQTGQPRPAEMAGQKKRRAARGLIVRALEAAPNDRARERIADAVNRFSGDAECASSGGSLTMNWQILAVGPRSASPRATDHLPGYARARASESLRQLCRAIGVERFQILEWVIVQEMSAAELCRRLGFRTHTALKFVSDLLVELADAYDQAVQQR